MLWLYEIEAGESSFSSANDQMRDKIDIVMVFETIIIKVTVLVWLVKQ